MSLINQSGKDMAEMFELERQYQMKKAMAECILNSDTDKNEITQKDYVFLFMVLAIIMQGANPCPNLT